MWSGYRHCRRWLHRTNSQSYIAIYNRSLHMRRLGVGGHLHPNLQLSRISGKVGSGKHPFNVLLQCVWNQKQLKFNLFRRSTIMFPICVLLIIITVINFLRTTPKSLAAVASSSPIHSHHKRFGVYYSANISNPLKQTVPLYAYTSLNQTRQHLNPVQ